MIRTICIHGFQGDLDRTINPWRMNLSAARWLGHYLERSIYSSCTMLIKMEEIYREHLNFILSNSDKVSLQSIYCVSGISNPVSSHK